MALSEEKRQILAMLEAKKVSVDDAAKLLDALESQQVQVKGRVTASTLVIKVVEQDKEHVNVKLPVSLAQLAWEFLPKEWFQANGDFRALFQSIQAGARGKLVEIDQPEEHRKITLIVE